VNTDHLDNQSLAKTHACADATGLFREADQNFGALRTAKKGKKWDSVTILDGANLSFFFGSCSLDKKVFESHCGSAL